WWCRSRSHSSCRDWQAAIARMPGRQRRAQQQRQTGGSWKLRMALRVRNSPGRDGLSQTPLQLLRRRFVPAPDGFENRRRLAAGWALPIRVKCYLPNLAFRLAATEAGTKADTLPPIPAIWRTSVAVIGRTATEAGTNTVCTLGAMASFMPAICIS